MAVTPLAAGTTLGRIRTSGQSRYRLGECLGGGGFGLAYEAYDLEHERRVVIKEFAPVTLAHRTEVGDVRPAKQHAPEFARALQRFVREAHALSASRHPNVVRVYHAWTERNTAYYSMAHVTGARAFPTNRDLHAFSGVRKRVALSLTVLDALRAVHEQGLIHGDLKPNNVLIAEDLQPYLIDFGTARTTDSLSAATVTVLFTPGWCPPELSISSRVREAGPWSDLYSWAMLCWGMFLPHSASTGEPVDAMTRVLGNDPYQNAAERLKAAGAPVSWAHAVAACLELVPGDRPDGVDAVHSIISQSRTATESDAFEHIGARTQTAFFELKPGEQRGRLCGGCSSMSPPHATYCVRCGLELCGPVVARDTGDTASMLRRSVAVCIDAAAAFFAATALLASAGGPAATASQDEAAATFLSLWFITFIALDAVCTMLASTTLGRSLTKIGLRTTNGKKLSWWRALLRSVGRAAAIVSIVGWFAYAWALLDPSRRTLIDLVTGTRAVRTLTKSAGARP